MVIIGKTHPLLPTYTILNWMSSIDLLECRISGQCPYFGELNLCPLGPCSYMKGSKLGKSISSCQPSLFAYFKLLYTDPLPFVTISKRKSSELLNSLQVDKSENLLTWQITKVKQSPSIKFWTGWVRLSKTSKTNLCKSELNYINFTFPAMGGCQRTLNILVLRWVKISFLFS